MEVLSVTVEIMGTPFDCETGTRDVPQNLIFHVKVWRARKRERSQFRLLAFLGIFAPTRTRARPDSPKRFTLCETIRSSGKYWTLQGTLKLIPVKENCEESKHKKNKEKKGEKPLRVVFWLPNKAGN